MTEDCQEDLPLQCQSWLFADREQAALGSAPSPQAEADSLASWCPFIF